MPNSIVIFRNGKKRRAEVFRRTSHSIATLFDAAERGDVNARNNAHVSNAQLHWTKYRTLLLTGQHNLPNSQTIARIDEVMHADDPHRAIELYGSLKRTIDQNSLGYGGVPILTDLSVRYANPDLVMDEVYKPLYRTVPSGSYNVYGDETEVPFQDLSMGPRGDVRTVHSRAPGTGSFNCKPLGAETRMEMGEFLAANFPPVQHWLSQTEAVNSELAFNCEVDSCEFQATSGNYASGNYVTKTAGSRWTDAGVDPYADIVDLGLKIRSSMQPTLRLHVMVRPVWEALKTNQLLISRLSNNDLKILDEEMYFKIFQDCDGIVVSDVVRTFRDERRYVMRNLFQIVQVPDTQASAVELAVHGMRMAWQPIGSEATQGQYIVQYMDNIAGERGVMKYKKTFRSKTHVLANKAAAAYYTPIDPALMTPPI